MLGTLGIDLPRSRENALSRFGRPAKSSATEFVYEDNTGSDIGPIVLTLGFDGDRLVRARWVYSFD